MEFWITVGIAVAGVVSLVLHHSSNKKLNALGDKLDGIVGTVAKK